MTLRGEQGWNTSVDSLLRLFHGALVALVPVLDAARIPWRNGEAYDQWDAIAKVLYEKLVAEPMAWAVGSVEEFRLVSYDVLMPHLRDVSFIEVSNPSFSAGESAAFLRFTTNAEPLDSVEAVILDSHHGLTERVERLSLDEVRFKLRHNKERREHVSVTEIEVPF